MLLIVNTARKCTSVSPITQLKSLVELQKKFKDEGLKVLAFPCNQFKKGDPGKPDEIKKAYDKLGINF